jgi:iron(III) transport system ATP-binding protein
VYVTHDQAEALSMSDRIIVMDAGNIVEEGTPRALYRRPSSRFAADFIGAANIVALVHRNGTWTAPDGSTVRVTAAEHGAPDETRDAVLRSEHLGLRAQDGGGPLDGLNAMRGTVERLQYMGPHFEYAINVGGVPVNALSSDEFERGTAVLVTFRPQDVHLLPKPGG